MLQPILITELGSFNTTKGNKITIKEGQWHCSCIRPAQQVVFHYHTVQVVMFEVNFCYDRIRFQFSAFICTPLDYLSIFNCFKASCLNFCSILVQSHVTQHHHSTQQKGSWICHVFSCNVWCCSMNLEIKVNLSVMMSVMLIKMVWAIQVYASNLKHNPHTSELKQDLLHSDTVSGKEIGKTRTIQFKGIRKE